MLLINHLVELKIYSFGNMIIPQHVSLFFQPAIALLGVCIFGASERGKANCCPRYSSIAFCLFVHLTVY